MKLLAATAVYLVAASVAANRASADAPAPTLVTVTADEADVADGLRALATITPDLTTPPGRPIEARSAAQVAKLGLVVKDLVRAIDGEPAVGLAPDGAAAHLPIVYLDIVRGGKPVAIRIAVRYPAKLVATFDGDDLFRYHDLSFHLLKLSGANASALVTTELGPLRIGDLITKVDGKPASLDALTDGLSPTKARTTVLTLVRGDTTIAMTLAVSVVGALDALVAGAIKKIDDTHYTIDKKLIDQVLANPMALAKGARVVPSVKNGKPDGFKLYAIRPNSVFAKLGLENGDTLNTINGMDLTSADKALETYTKIHDAKVLVVVITRRGKSVTLTYTIQ